MFGRGKRAPDVAFSSPSPRRHDDEDERAGGWCPSCGDEFRVGVMACPDCGIELTHDRGAVRSERHDVVEYDLSEWDDEQRFEITRQLDLLRIAHEWHLGELRVPGGHEAEIDEMIDALDGFDRDAPAVEYELPEWTIEQCDELVRRLQEAGLSFDWDGCVLGVAPQDETTADAIVRAIDPTFPTQAGDEAQTGPL